MMNFRTLEERVRVGVNRLRNRRNSIAAAGLRKMVAKSLDRTEAKIPVFVVSYNNGVYVENTVRQLNHYGIVPIVIDNASTDARSLEILHAMHQEKRADVLISPKNFGHMVGFLNPIYEVMPEVFAYTDPDLQFHPDLPNDFLEVLADLTERYRVYKAGFALALLEDEEMIDLEIEKFIGVPQIYANRMGVREWEAQYWRMRLAHPELEIYQARHDTTFAVYRKSNLFDHFYDGIRVAGNYSAIHLPWYPRLDLMGDAERRRYLEGNRSSSWLENQ